MLNHNGQNNLAPHDPAPSSTAIDGVIKYKFTLKRENSLSEEDVLPLEKWRALLYRMNLIGEYPNEKIGYGNVSKRTLQKPDTFIITGSQTGRLAHLSKQHYVKIIHCELDKNRVQAEGLIPPSSESMTHFAIYQNNPNIKCIFHVHHRELWSDLILKNIPMTAPRVEYGTIEMANEVQKLVSGKKSGFFVTKDHEEGIFSFAEDLQTAGQIILNLMRDLRQK